MARFKVQFDQFKALAAEGADAMPLRWEEVMPCFGDDTAGTSFDRHYVYHPAWAARIVREIAPEEHVDISSTLHFCSMLSAFMPVRFYDYRPADLQLSGLTSESADLLRLPFADGSIRSLSCMHTIEHIGLGRYGDPIDPTADRKAMAELQRVTAPGGHLLIVVPTGAARVVFNAHRIYSFAMIAGAFPGFELKEFALVPDDPAHGGLIRNATAHMADMQRYGCGCYWFIKNR
ncbi:MAG TPA: DUF268 domain-containing protein [Flavobacteriales bacterium]|nr:DUF268 domain-containing protein [Flavobacteriales bacterium]